MKKRKSHEDQTSGLPPGTLVYTGEKKTDFIRIRVLDYSESDVREKEIGGIENCLSFCKEDTVTWINVTGLHETEFLRKTGEHLGIHSLTLEDILNINQRPKVEEFDTYVYIVLKMIYPGREGMDLEQVSLILGDKFVVTFQEKPGDVFDAVRRRIRENRGRIRKMGCGYLAYALIDAIVDNYFSILEYFDDRIEEIEEKLLGNPEEKTQREIHNIKRELIKMKRAVWPERELISSLERNVMEIFDEDISAYLRDLHDHTIQVIDGMEYFRDMISNLHDMYLTSISNRMNEVMKVLTIIATIFIPITFIAGVYGMNFRYMPELEWRLGYPSVLLLMAVIAIALLWYFRKKKWL